MSGGQQQRVALARALVNRPRALLLDEPLGALDLRLRKQLQIELSHIQREVGITFVHVTHDQEEAMTMADTIAVMTRGRIDQLGGRPSSTTAAHRVRRELPRLSNLLDAQARRQRRGTRRRSSADGARPQRAGRPAGASGYGPVRIGVRPEKITLRPEDEATDRRDNVLLGHVTDASFLGVSTQYVVRTDGGEDIQGSPRTPDRASRPLGPGRASPPAGTRTTRSSSPRSRKTQQRLSRARSRRRPIEQPRS